MVAPSLSPRAGIRCNACGTSLASLTAPCRCKNVHGERDRFAPAVPVAVASKGRSHFNAKDTTCLLGHAHPSKVEARVCARLHHERADGDVIYRNVRLPLFALPPTARGIAMYLNVDFVVTRDRHMVRIIDAKSGKRSRDWSRGAAACEATYGLKVEEMS